MMKNVGASAPPEARRTSGHTIHDELAALEREVKAELAATESEVKALLEKTRVVHFHHDEERGRVSAT